MTPQERLFQATQQLAVAQSKVDSAKKADDVASDTLYAATSAAAVAAAKLAFDTTAQAAAIAAEPIASEALVVATAAEATATAVLTAASADLAAAGVAAGVAVGAGARPLRMELDAGGPCHFDSTNARRPTGPQSLGRDAQPACQRPLPHAGR